MTESSNDISQMEEGTILHNSPSIPPPDGTILEDNISPLCMSMKKSRQVKTICGEFAFTKTFPPATTQSALFDRVLEPQMKEFLAGQDCVTMIYGTTNAGKSHTMQGSPSCPGIIPRSLEYIFSHIKLHLHPLYKPDYKCGALKLTVNAHSTEADLKKKILSPILKNKADFHRAYEQMQQIFDLESIEEQRSFQGSGARHSVWISFAEIYNESIYDLLSGNNQKCGCSLELVADSQGEVFVKDLCQVSVNSVYEAHQILMAGQCNLRFGATSLNSHSSRSQCIFTITLLKYQGLDRPQQVEMSRFSFCDLAGSERMKKTLNVGDRLKEVQNINKSLMVLGKCLRSIYKDQKSNQRKVGVGSFRESKFAYLF